MFSCIHTSPNKKCALFWGKQNEEKEIFFQLWLHRVGTLPTAQLTHPPIPTRAKASFIPFTAELLADLGCSATN